MTRAQQAAAVPSLPPAAERSGRWLGPMHATGIFWFRAIVWLSRRSDWVIRPGVLVSAAFFCAVMRRMRRIVAGNLEPVLGPCGFFERQRRLWRVFHQHAWCLVERFEQFRSDLRPRVDFSGAGWPAIHSSAEGALLFSAHFGNWEIGPLIPLAGQERRVHVVREPEEHAAAQRYFEQLLAAHPGAEFVTHFVGRDPQLGATLLLALRRGDIVTLAGDRPRAGMDALRSEMFGRPIDLPLGPIALARAAETPLVPVFVFRRGRRHYEVVGRPPIHVRRSDDRARDHREAADRVAAEIAWAIGQAPFQWFRSEPVYGDD